MVELARRTGIPRSTLAYQINVSALSVNNLLAIASSLGVPAADLLSEQAA
jgi:transcriptional regulator with XRE-family HTH domain